MILVMKRRKGEGLVVGLGEEYATVIVAGFPRARNRRRAVRFRIGAPGSWLESQVVSLQAGESAILGPTNGIRLHVLSIRKRGRNMVAQIAAIPSKRFFAHRIEVWEAIHGKDAPISRDDNPSPDESGDPRS